MLPDATEERSPGNRWLRRRRLVRRMRRLVRRCTRRAAPTLATARFDLDRADELTTEELWTVWTLANLECALELRAWGLVPRRQRPRVFASYRAALAREARVAKLLAER
jgi:hypothetical protein